ncbi:MAG: PTS sugar transporter subunit IIB [Lacrimispora celerecrescens]|uniref:PTS sugar transporter subunit IIB n=1 Tax=Lacrimispora indolis TaxID=69825 RepID=UPI00040F2502|nr:PTS sugar transporter subunit IIB [[Clostridium] methoxybenzovorans]MBE7722312.1 PTS sugar transporter subunit IIB [Lacrimispora celerecrescens]
MIKIRLFCNQGMSTSLLVSKMKQAALEEGLEADIAAFPVNDLDENLGGVDCALLGPQVGYLKDKVSKTCENQQVPLDVIPMVDYGMCNGKKVLEFARKLAGK